MQSSLKQIEEEQIN
jgi:hypothetical protein